jgi:hypothetical protein
MQLIHFSPDVSELNIPLQYARSSSALPSLSVETRIGSSSSEDESDTDPLPSISYH